MHLARGKRKVAGPCLILDVKLCDELKTLDDILLELLAEKNEIFSIKYIPPRKPGERLGLLADFGSKLGERDYVFDNNLLKLLKFVNKNGISFTELASLFGAMDIRERGGRTEQLSDPRGDLTHRFMTLFEGLGEDVFL